jgi:hypothetical protein
MSSQRKSNRPKSVIHRLMRPLDALTAWIARNVVEPRARVPALARARVNPRRYRGPVRIGKK